MQGTLALNGLKKRYIGSSHEEVLLGKGVLKICSKFIGEHPWQRAISINLPCNFIEIALQHGCSPVNLLHILDYLFLRTPLYCCFWYTFKTYFKLNSRTSPLKCNIYFWLLYCNLENSLLCHILCRLLWATFKTRIPRIQTRMWRTRMWRTQWIRRTQRIWRMRQTRRIRRTRRIQRFRRIQRIRRIR